MGYNTATIRESFRYPGTKTQAQRGRDQNYICSKELIGKVIYVSADYYTGMLSQNGLHGTGQAAKFSDNVNLVLAIPNNFVSRWKNFVYQPCKTAESGNTHRTSNHYYLEFIYLLPETCFLLLNCEIFPRVSNR